MKHKTIDPSKRADLDRIAHTIFYEVCRLYHVRIDTLSYPAEKLKMTDFIYKQLTKVDVVARKEVRKHYRNKKGGGKVRCLKCEANMKCINDVNDESTRIDWLLCPKCGSEAEVQYISSSGEKFKVIWNMPSKSPAETLKKCEDDLRKYYALPPYHSGGNTCHMDSYFMMDIQKRFTANDIEVITYKLYDKYPEFIPARGKSYE